MSTHKRDVPLSASPTYQDLSEAPTPVTAPANDKFDDGVRSLRVGRTSIKLEERLLMVLGGILAPVGLLVVLLGWVGASRTPHLFEQVPYLISGGLFGIALVFLGAFFYFAHWLTQLVKEHRSQSEALLDAVAALREEVRAVSGPAAVAAPSPNGVDPTDGSEPTLPPLVATERGTMAHRPSCAVVAGKAGLRTVTAADGLASCKLCDPYGD